MTTRHQTHAQTRTIDERQCGAQHARVDCARLGIELDHIVEHDAIQIAGECECGAHLVESANLELWKEGWR